jgi:c-di-GMP-binding flagellar brake protein YcgR
MSFPKERREFLRVDDIVPVTYKKMVSPQDPLDPRGAMRKDISGGGIRLITNEELPKGTILELKFQLPDVPNPTEIKVLGEVVWTQKIEEEGKTKYASGVAYVNIAESERRKIIQYVFNKHRRQKLLEKEKNK